jgi:phosphate transport system permease protein
MTAGMTASPPAHTTGSEDHRPNIGSLIAQHHGRVGGRAYAAIRWGGALVFVAVVVSLVVSLVWQSAPAFRHSGFSFIFSGNWDPTAEKFGSGIFIIDTMITTVVALVIIVPVGLGTAIALSELLPGRIGAALSTCIDLLAAVPSIVVGLWGLLVLVPIFERHVEPTLQKIPLIKHLFGGGDLGSGILLASVVLAVMSLPTMISLTRTALRGVSVADREAAMALGGTKWQVVRIAVIPGARSGIEAAITLATGRALGEAIAVALVIGGGVTLPHSLLSTGTTLGSAIVNYFSEAVGIQRSAVIGLVVVLLAFTAVFNIGGQILVRHRPGRKMESFSSDAPLEVEGASV